MQGLADNPRPRQSIKLSGTESYRLRVGDYRILYEINNPAKSVTVYRIKHRREVYR
jgi:mRNA interferase RelE/StbE